MTGNRKKAYLLVNPNAGLAEKTREIELIKEYCSKQDVAIKELRSDQFSTPYDFRQLCHANNIKFLITNGGDGTVNYVLPYLINSDITLLPLRGGTFNHFAKHIGIPPSVENALELLTKGQERTIDVGEVNGHLFVNFSTIGFYAEVIYRRTYYQKRNIPKWIAFVMSLIRTFKNYHSNQLSFPDNSDRVIRTPLLFVGNNEFKFGSADFLQSREKLTERLLHIGILKDMSKFKLTLFIWRAMHADLKKYVEFTDVTVPKLVVKTPHKKVRATLDGEVVLLKAPLVFVSRPKSLTVLVP